MCFCKMERTVHDMKERTYEEVIEEIENKRRFENLAGVEITERMLEKLKGSCKVSDFIHIAGTNGKGSVSAFLCAILQEAGLKTGMFTSPHLMDFGERIRINGEMIAKEDAKRLGEALLAMDFGVHPTMFDYCLMMALLYFKEKKCDAMILETGLGGRLDSTNAVGIPDVSVITKIGYDHMAILGDTLSEIAAEKAGIIKPGTILVTESQESSVQEVFSHAVKEAGVTDYRRVNLSEITDRHADETGEYFSFENYKNLSMKMLGVHQYENAAAAILAAEAFLGKRGMEPARIRTAVRAGIEKAVWQGRMEILNREPFLMVDGAHNSNGVAALKESLLTLFPGEKFHFIMGVMADKDYEKMVEELLPLALDFVTVTVESERALQADSLAACIEKKGVTAYSCANLKECFDLKKWDTAHKTVAFGSLYFIGEVEAFFTKVFRN